MDEKIQNSDPFSFLDQYDLIYSSTDQKGYSRKRKGDDFVYFDTFGKPITSERTLKRIEALVLPPAWEDVWICSKANGHLQAVGVDDKGRKQYMYHEKWVKLRNETKFNQLYFFGKKLKRLRRQLKKHLRKRKLTKDKVTALALSVMEVTLLRVGNVSYEKEYGSYGLTTLKNRHVKFEKGHAFFKFKGKKGVEQRVEMHGKRLVNQLKKVKELPGQEVFQYYDDDGNLHSLDSSDINEYLQKHMKGDFTAKDFRTWAGCITAISCMAQAPADVFKTKTGTHKALVAIIDEVADKLGNTRAVCKKYYIHPGLVDSFEKGEFSKLFEIGEEHVGNTEVIEKAFLKFLKKKRKG